MASAAEILTEQITKALEAGTIPWRKTWAGGLSGPAANLNSGRRYTGFNALWLSFVAAMTGYTVNLWATYDGAKRLGGNVRADEKGTKAVYYTVTEKCPDCGKWSKATYTDDAGYTCPKCGHHTDDKPEVRFFAKYYNLFNIAQCDGLDAYMPDDPGKQDHTPIADIEAVFANMQNPPKIVHPGRPSYAPKLDTVYMPELGQYEAPEHYYHDLAHEVAHSTGHASRLNRPGITDFDVWGDAQYAREELVAEMAAALLAIEWGISAPTFDLTAAYVASWLEVLNDDPNMVIRAASDAQKAVNYILSNGAA